ncbi:12426_t:CDS:2, partial [Gigaspora margarita]
ILLQIKVDAKVSVLGFVVDENIACSLLDELWNTKRLLAMIIQAILGKNHNEKGANQYIIDDSVEENSNKTDYSSSSNSECDQDEDEEIINANEIVTIDSCQVSRSYSKFMRFIGLLTIIIYIKCADICDYWAIKQETAGVLLSFGQYMRFQKFIKYLKQTDVTENSNPFYFAWQFYDSFNDNLTMAISSGSYL